MRRALLLLILALGCEKRAAPRIEHTNASTAPTPSTSVAIVPHRALHDGVTVAIEGGTIRETAPYLEPDAERRPVTMILHALCADEKWMCDWLQHGDLGPQWQICPRAPIACGNGGAQWSAPTTDVLHLLEHALAATKSRHPDRVRDEGLVLAGMSQGAYAIARLVHELAEHPSPTLKPKGLVLHGASITLSPVDLKKLGVRVVLAAGDDDGAAPKMKALANALKSQGVEARYASFGPVGHFLPVDTASTMAELIAWARGE
ncbi:MAG: alpha/beta hydrolase [Polyangiales bacterium]